MIVIYFFSIDLVIRRNQEVEDDGDEIGMHDNVFNSSQDKSLGEDRKSQENLSNIDEANEDDENITNTNKGTFVRKSDITTPKRKPRKKKKSSKRRNFPNINVTKMSTMNQDTVKGSRLSDHSKKSKQPRQIQQ